LYYSCLNSPQLLFSCILGFCLPEPVLQCLFVYASSHLLISHPRFAVLEFPLHKQGLVATSDSCIYFSFFVKNCIFILFLFHNCLKALSLSGLRMKTVMHVCSWMVRLCLIVGFVLGWINCNHSSSNFLFFFFFFANNYQPPSLLHCTTSTRYIKLFEILCQLMEFSILIFLKSKNNSTNSGVLQG